MTDALPSTGVHVSVDATDASATAAKMILDLVRSKPNAVLGLATGSTPTKVYQYLIRNQEFDPIDWSYVTTFNLDEYVGLTPDHPQSFHSFMRAELFEGLNLTEDQYHLPPGVHDDLASAAAEYESSILRSGGIDLQILGIGENGHIAFNEPGSAGDSRTRVLDLTENTINANARFFESPGDVPRTAITMGIGTILEAKQILLLAFGQRKAQAVKDSIEADVSKYCPASFLQSHPNVTFLLDEDAASLLNR